jgi:hypothetical protein
LQIVTGTYHSTVVLAMYKLKIQFFSTPPTFCTPSLFVRLHPLSTPPNSFFFQDFLTISNFRFKTGKHLERASERTKYLRRRLSCTPSPTLCNATVVDERLVMRSIVFRRYSRALFQFSLCVFTTDLMTPCTHRATFLDRPGLLQLLQ